jgi:hypothetical protein
MCQVKLVKPNREGPNGGATQVSPKIGESNVG